MRTAAVPEIPHSRQKRLRLACLPLVAMASIQMAASGQVVNSGSDGHDGALNPATNVVIDMADHPDGIYQYTSVNIPNGVTVSFIPNTNNTPVVWLVQNDVLINGVVKLSGGDINGPDGQPGGPGGWAGGQASAEVGNPPLAGRGPGGGLVDVTQPYALGANAAFGSPAASVALQHPGGAVYGNQFLLPLLGGSGGSGGYADGYDNGGGGGGGAILMVATGVARIDGSILANGGGAPAFNEGIGFLGGGGGSGGAVRIVSGVVAGSGTIDVSGGLAGMFTDYGAYGPRPRAGGGRIRIDAMDDSFNGGIGAEISRGFQPIIIPAAGEGMQLAIASIAGASVPANPSSTLTDPAVIIPGQVGNPMPVVVQCQNIPLNTAITVVAKPANGVAVQGGGFNATGTEASSTAMVMMDMPRGGGIIYAQAVIGVNAGAASELRRSQKSQMREIGPGRARSPSGPAPTGRPAQKPGAASQVGSLKRLPLSMTGLAANGERFAKVEIKAPLGGRQQTTYITTSGKRFTVKGK